MSARIADEWNKHFVAYEDALASYYSLQDATRTLDQSRAITNGIEGLARLRAPILAARHQLRLSAEEGRVKEIDRDRATIHSDGVAFAVRDLAAHRTATPDTILELSFRVDPKSIPRFVNLTSHARIRFPFGRSAFVAECRLVKFKLERHEFAFRFATVDPG